MIRSTQANIAVSSAIGLLHVQLKLKKEIPFINFDYGIDHSNIDNILFFFWQNFYIGLKSNLPAIKWSVKCRSILYLATWIANSSVN